MTGTGSQKVVGSWPVLISTIPHPIRTATKLRINERKLTICILLAPPTATETEMATATPISKNTFIRSSMNKASFFVTYQSLWGSNLA